MPGIVAEILLFTIHHWDCLCSRGTERGNRCREHAGELSVQLTGVYSQQKLNYVGNI